jgi:hypothetical protein
MKIYTLSAPEHLYRDYGRGKQHFNDDLESAHSFCGLFLEITHLECDLEEEEKSHVSCKKCIKIAKSKL